MTARRDPDCATRAFTAEAGDACGCDGPCTPHEPSRRDFLQLSASAALTSAADARARGAAPATARIPESARTPPPAEWYDALDQRGAPTVYQGASLRFFAFPLGGIGTGSIALHGSGRLTQWQIFNNFDPSAFVDDSFFAVRVKPVAADRPPITRALHTRGIGFSEGVDALRIIAQYPFAEVEYVDRLLPISVGLEVFNPLIPLNPDDSALPCAVFRFRVHNPTDEAVDVSLLATLQNAVGHSGHGGSVGVIRSDYGGNVNEPWDDDGITAVRLRAEAGEPAGPAFEPGEEHTALHRSVGTMTLATDHPNVTRRTVWTNRAALLAELKRNGRFEFDPKPNAPTPAGMTVNAALCANLRLEPDEHAVIPFLYTWHFPNHYLGAGRRRASSSETPFIGNRYAVRFADADAAARYLLKHLDRLYDDTRRFRDALFDSSLPQYLLECLAANASTIRSQTCLWIADGTFAAYEGAGCCPMNCNHVFNYAQTLARLFPSLERNMRRTAFGFHQDADGSLRQRVTIPVPAAPTGPRPAIDGQAGAVLKTYREYLNTTDDAFLREYWPHARRAVEYLIETVDRDADGVLEGRQFSTYDQYLTGRTPYTTGLYVAALLSAEQMARRTTDDGAAQRYRSLARRGAHTLGTRLYNGKYFIQQGGVQIADGCHADQLFGQWWIDLLGLPALLPEEKIRSALRAIAKHNWITDHTDVRRGARARRFADGRDKGLLNCTWPVGAPPKHALEHADECWTGVEYQVAATMIRHGLVREGLALVKGARERYDGTRRNPFSEIECGEHYARAMSSWSLLLACQGFQYDGPAGVLSFDPVLHPDAHRSFFTTAAAWGTFTQTRTAKAQTNTLTVRYGELELTTLRVTVAEGSASKNLTVELRTSDTDKASNVAASHDVEHNAVTIRFAVPLSVQHDQTLRITIGLNA